MPTAIALHLTGPTDVAIPVDAPHAALAGRIEGDIAEHHRQVKPFALGPPIDHGDGVQLRVALLDDDLVIPLAASIGANPAVRLGAHRYRITRLQPLGQSTWTELSTVTDNRAWRVEFTSPVTFRRGNRSSPWPAPESIVRSLVGRWRTLHPATAPWLPDQLLRSVWISAIHGDSHLIQGPDSIISGFTGTIDYRADQRDDAAAFDRILALAEYAGMGSHTAMGFGQVTATPLNTDRPDRIG